MFAPPLIGWQPACRIALPRRHPRALHLSMIPSKPLLDSSDCVLNRRHGNSLQSPLLSFVISASWVLHSSSCAAYCALCCAVLRCVVGVVSLKMHEVARGLHAQKRP